MTSIAGFVKLSGGGANAPRPSRPQHDGAGPGYPSWSDGMATLASMPDGPVWDAEARVALAIDGRIDGRRELRSACDAAGCKVHGETQAELVLRAYQAWGENAPRRILGDYAFAIWDQAAQRLICARDSGGVRPLYYAELPDGSFHFATNALQVLSSSSLPRTPDKPGLIDFLLSSGALLPERSPWSSVSRLGAAQSLVFDRSGLRCFRYWSVYETPSAKFSNQAEAVEACSYALQAAIRDRVQGMARAGISLSGGWDSGAAYVLWHSMRQNDPTLAEPWTYTYYADGADADERAEVGKLIRRRPAAGKVAALRADRGIDGLESHNALLGVPEPAPGWRWLNEFAAAARAAGVTTVIAGEAGNEVFQSSILRPADSVRSGRIFAAVRQVKAWGRDNECSPRSFLWPFVIRPALAAWFPGVWDIGRRLRSMGRFQVAAHPYLTDDCRQLALDLVSQTQRRNQVHARGRAIASWDKRAGLDRWCGTLFPLPAGPEWGAVKMTSPYLDRRVVTAALAALDAETGEGSTRRLLASTVKFATGFAFQGRHAHYTDIHRKMLRTALDRSGDIFDASSLVELGLADSRRVADFVERFRSGGNRSLSSVWRLVSAEAWARSLISGRGEVARSEEPCREEACREEVRREELYCSKGR